MKIKLKNIKAFTLVELLVSIAIFALMTALLVAKYGNFNQSILLNNLAYDIALNIRSAQSYGLNVRGVASSGGNPSEFKYPFGVRFINNNNNFILFADIDADGFYDTGETILSTVTIKSVASIDSLCVTNNNSCSGTVNSLNITFKRPDPNAIIRGNSDSNNMGMAEIVIKSTDGSKKKIVIRSNGQIGVENVISQDSNTNSQAE